MKKILLILFLFLNFTISQAEGLRCVQHIVYKHQFRTYGNHANTWCNRAREQNFPVNWDKENVKEWEIIFWNYGQFWHVAEILNVYENSIFVEDSNWIWTKEVTTHRVTKRTEQFSCSLNFNELKKIEKDRKLIKETFENENKNEIWEVIIEMLKQK